MRSWRRDDCAQMVSLLVWLSGVRGVSSRGRGCISGAAGTPRNKPKGVPCVKRVGAREEGCALLAAGSGRLYPQDTVFARGYSKREGAPLAERGVRGGMEGCGVLGSRVAGLQDGWEQGARPTKPGSVWHGEQRAVVNGAGGRGDHCPSGHVHALWGAAQTQGPFSEASVAGKFGGHADNRVTVAVVFPVPPSHLPRSPLPDMRIHCSRTKSRRLTYWVK